MTKDMKEHKKYIEERMEKLEAEGLVRLFMYHKTRMRDFQHERLIHFLVTSLVCVITVSMIMTTVFTKEYMFYVVDILLLPLVLAYFVHYRSLENGVQELYDLTKQLGKKCFEV